MSQFMNYIGYIGSFLLLLICSIEDIRHKKVSMKSFFIMIPFLILSMIFNHQISLTSRLLGFLIGVVFLIISKLTRGQIGMGDGYLICIVGITLGCYKSLEILSYTFFLSAIAAIIFLVIYKLNKKKTIPFVPFLLLGFLSCVIFNGASL